MHTLHNHPHSYPDTWVLCLVGFRKLTTVKDIVIMEKAAKPEGRLKLGTLLVSIAREAGGLTNAEAEQFNQSRDKTPAEPMRFE